MIKPAWKFYSIVVALIGATIFGCSDGSTHSAGTTFETENDIALTILNEDGTPAANARVFIRPADYLAGSLRRDVEDSFSTEKESPVSATDTAAGIFNAFADEYGRVSIKVKTNDSSYMVEARGEATKAVTKVSLAEENSVYTTEIILLKPGSVSGQVYLPSGVTSATVSIEGMEYFVKTDSLGNFTFESLPEGTLNLVSFVYKEQIYNVDGETQVFSSCQNLGTSAAKVTSEEELTDIYIGEVPKDSDTTEEVSDYLFENFENGVSSWYTSFVEGASISLDLTEASEGRDGSAAHISYTDTVEYGWTLIGYAFSEIQDFTTMDSLSLWVRGETADTQWVSISFDVLVDSTSEYTSGKAWVHKAITADWVQYVIKPTDFIEPENSNGGNLGWDAVKDHITNFNIFAGGTQGEIWIDDIEIYGVKNLERPLP